MQSRAWERQERQFTTRHLINVYGWIREA
jgi:hypothetical protein